MMTSQLPRYPLRLSYESAMVRFKELKKYFIIHKTLPHFLSMQMMLQMLQKIHTLHWTSQQPYATT